MLGDWATAGGEERRERGREEEEGVLSSWQKKLKSVNGKTVPPNLNWDERHCKKEKGATSIKQFVWQRPRTRHSALTSYQKEKLLNPLTRLPQKRPLGYVINSACALPCLALTLEIEPESWNVPASTWMMTERFKDRQLFSCLLTKDFPQKSIPRDQKCEFS